jgi:hypothetical protein
MPFQWYWHTLQATYIYTPLGSCRKLLKCYVICCWILVDSPFRHKQTVTVVSTTQTLQPENMLLISLGPALLLSVIMLRFGNIPHTSETCVIAHVNPSHSKDLLLWWYRFYTEFIVSRSIDEATKACVSQNYVLLV